MSINNLESYGTIFIGYPIWWGKMPMVFSTLFEQYDFADKTIIPFCTYGGNGGPKQSQATFRNTVTDIKHLAPQSTVLDGLAIQGVSVGSAGNDISAWLGRLDTLIKGGN